MVSTWATCLFGPEPVAIGIITGNKNITVSLTDQDCVSKHGRIEKQPGHHAGSGPIHRDRIGLLGIHDWTGATCARGPYPVSVHIALGDKGISSIVDADQRGVAKFSGSYESPRDETVAGGVHGDILSNGIGAEGPVQHSICVIPGDKQARVHQGGVTENRFSSE